LDQPDQAADEEETHRLQRKKLRAILLSQMNPPAVDFAPWRMPGFLVEEVLMSDPRADSRGHEPSEKNDSGEGPVSGTGQVPDKYLDEQEDQSFPASDPHSDWAGPGPGQGA
jgi:hypothetical protein